MKTSSLLLASIVLAFDLNGAQAGETVETRIGPLEFTHGFRTGYPTDDTVRKLYDELDFQRAVQAYIWSIPIVSMAQWRWSHENELGAKNGEIVVIETYKDRLGGLTYNATTPYVLPFIDLSEGPWVLEMPGPTGSVRGAAHDMWQIGITAITEPGKYLFVGPGQDIPTVESYNTFQSPTNGILLGIRLMPEERDKAVEVLKQVKVYPFSEADDPKPRKLIRPEEKAWMAAQPVGLRYWELLADTINREPVQERDRFFIAMLKPLGIEKGKPCGIPTNSYRQS